MNTPKTKRVTIPSTPEHEGNYFHLITIELEWTCPRCQGPRGEVSQVCTWDGSLSMMCDGWVNPCGHVDKYTDVLEEAQARELAMQEREA